MDRSLGAAGTTTTSSHVYRRRGQADSRLPRLVGNAMFASCSDKAEHFVRVPSARGHRITVACIAVGALVLAASSAARAAERSTAGISATAVGLPGYRDFVRADPPILDWPDRRSIGALFLATAPPKPLPGNPRGW